MSVLDNLTAFLPLKKKEEKKEYFFAVNIETENLTAALWGIEGKELKILQTATEAYLSEDDIINVLDKLLDAVLGLKQIEPQKILFGVPSSWVLDDNLKEEKLEILRKLVKELELTPMAYVVTANALGHFLKRQEGIPATAVLAGIEKKHISVAVVRAGKLDGVKTIKRSDSAGADIEKALLQFADIETLPSKILIFGLKAEELKPELLSFSWMSKLSFLHFPKIDVLDENIGIKSICVAGGSEINSNISYTEQSAKEGEEEIAEDKEAKEVQESSVESVGGKDLGFIVGDIEDNQKIPQETALEVEDFKEEVELPVPERTHEEAKSALTPIKGKFNVKIFGFVLIGLIVLLFGAYMIFAKADVKVFVEPKVLEKEAQVIADPNQNSVNEVDRIIPGQIVETEVSGSAKGEATGKRQIGDPAKGTVVIYNKTADSQTLSKGTQLSSGGLKFTLDSSATVASQSALDSGISFGKVNAKVTASSIGADSNLPSGAAFTIGGFASDKLAAKAEGNFSGGTSRDVTVVSSEDAQKLLARLSSDFKQQAQGKLQEKYPAKKILKEALAENIIRKSYSKNINDAASEFSLTMTASYKGTAFDDADLKTIISKLVTTEVPSDFKLDLSGTETQADVAGLEKNGRLIFSAKFKAKLLPKVDPEQIKNMIKFKGINEAQGLIKGIENVLGSDVKISPKLPSIFARLPLLSRNIRLEVGLK